MSYKWCRNVEKQHGNVYKNGVEMVQKWHRNGVEMEQKCREMAWKCVEMVKYKCFNGEIKCYIREIKKIKTLEKENCHVGKIKVLHWQNNSVTLEK